MGKVKRSYPFIPSALFMKFHTHSPEDLNLSGESQAQLSLYLARTLWNSTRKLPHPFAITQGFGILRVSFIHLL